MVILRRRWRPAARMSALAAALTLLMVATPPAAANPLAPIWTGLYVGAHGGASWADIDTISFGSLESTRAAFGGHIGYNVGLGGFVVGVEADASHAGSTFGFATTGGGTASVDTDWSGSLRGRLGFTVGPALLYATAGWAWTGVSLAERSAAGTQVKSSGTLDGAVYGIGAEAFVLPSISLRLEALRYEYGRETLSLGSGLSALREIDHGDTVVRAGLTLHFR